MPHKSADAGQTVHGKYVNPLARLWSQGSRVISCIPVTDAASRSARVVKWATE
jgi:hypothetical protein